MDPKKFRQLVKLDEHRQLCQQSADSGLGRSHSDIRQSNMSNVRKLSTYLYVMDCEAKGLWEIWNAKSH